MTQQEIVSACRARLAMFAYMPGVEIDAWLVEHFPGENRQMLRRSSFVIFEESRNALYNNVERFQESGVH